MKIPKIPEYCTNLFQKTQKCFVQQNRFFSNGNPIQTFEKGILTKFNPEGKMISQKTPHEYIEFIYDNNGNRLVKTYICTPKFFVRGQHKMLYEKYLLKE